MKTMEAPLQQERPIAPELLKREEEMQASIDQVNKSESMQAFAEAAEDGVSGDYLSVKRMDSGNIFVVMYDFKNHGETAAKLREQILTDELEQIQSPAEYINTADNAMKDRFERMTLTPMAAMEIDHQNYKLRISGQGTPIYTFNTTTGSLERHLASGGPIGMGMRKKEEVDLEVALQPDDIVLATTDGLADTLRISEPQLMKRIEKYAKNAEGYFTGEEITHHLEDDVQLMKRMQNAVVSLARSYKESTPDGTPKELLDIILESDLGVLETEELADGLKEYISAVLSKSESLDVALTSLEDRLTHLADDVTVFTFDMNKLADTQPAEQRERYIGERMEFPLLITNLLQNNITILELYSDPEVVLMNKDGKPLNKTAISKGEVNEDIFISMKEYNDFVQRIRSRKRGSAKDAA